MEINVSKQLQSCFSKSQSLFAQLMALSGECFRQLEGRITQRVCLDGKYYFIKQHFGVGWREVCKNLLQLRLPIISAKNEWLAIQKLQTLNVLVPNMVAYGKRGLSPAHQQSFVLLEEISPHISLETLCAKWRMQPPAFAFKQMLIREVARITRIMHENGINHRDLYICHFLLDTTHNVETILPEQLKLYLIDLHRAKCRRLTPKRWIIKDLVGLYFSSKDIGLTQRDWYRFMRAYQGKPLREMLNSEKVFWKKVKKRGEQLYRDHTK